MSRTNKNIISNDLIKNSPKLTPLRSHIRMVRTPTEAHRTRANDLTHDGATGVTSKLATSSPATKKTAPMVTRSDKYDSPMRDQVRRFREPSELSNHSSHSGVYSGLDSAPIKREHLLIQNSRAMSEISDSSVTRSGTPYNYHFTRDQSLPNFSSELEQDGRNRCSSSRTPQPPFSTPSSHKLFTPTSTGDVTNSNDNNNNNNNNSSKRMNRSKNGKNTMKHTYDSDSSDDSCISEYRDCHTFAEKFTKAVKTVFSYFCAKSSYDDCSDTKSSRRNKKSKNSNIDAPNSNFYKNLLYFIMPVLIVIFAFWIISNEHHKIISNSLLSSSSVNQQSKDNSFSQASSKLSDISAESMKQSAQNAMEQLRKVNPTSAFSNQNFDTAAIEKAIRESDLDERVRKMDAYITSLQNNIENMENQIKVLMKSSSRFDKANLFLNKDIRNNRVISEQKFSEMSDKLESITAISKNSVDNPTMDVANFANKNEVKMMIKAALEVYAADKIGLVDYALESIGGSIVPARTSTSYVHRTSEISIMGINLWYTGNSPRSVIQPQTSPGDCWAFPNSNGQVSVKLSVPIFVRSVTIDHIPSSLSIDNLASAPKNFDIIGYNEQDNEGHILGSFMYDVESTPLQTFNIKESKVQLLTEVQLMVNSNNGHLDYTCIYRFRVHGHPTH